MGMLECLEKYYENYNDLVFISDYETRKIVYLNRAGCKTCGYDYDKADYKGEFCYKALQGSNCVCADCPPRGKKETLRLNEFIEYDYVNSDTGKFLTVRNSLIKEDGRLYQVGIASNVEHIWRQRKALSAMLDHEEVIDRALELAMNESDPDRAINLMLSYLGVHLDSERCYIFEENTDGTFSNTYEWCRDGVEPEIDNLQNLPYEGLVDSWYREFDKQRNILIRDIEKLKTEDPSMYKVLLPQKIRTLVVGPLVINHHRIGFYGVDNPPAENIENISMIYDVLGHFLAAMLRHRDNERCIFKDPLTDVQNRGALDPYLKSLDADKSICYYFCDINNLKEENDQHGHASGDKLIRNTADVLKKCFDPIPVFRMGGDEFLAILTDITEIEAVQREKEIRQHFEEANISVALGCYWRPNGRESFDPMFHEVDQRMYRNKQEMHRSLKMHLNRKKNGTDPAAHPEH